MAWRIEFATSAQRELRKLSPDVGKRITRYLRDRVAGDPRSRGGALKGALGELWRYRVGDYRIICDLKDSTLTVLVVKIGDRKEVYR